MRLGKISPSSHLGHMSCIFQVCTKTSSEINCHSTTRMYSHKTANNHLQLTAPGPATSTAVCTTSRTPNIFSRSPAWRAPVYAAQVDATHRARRRYKLTKCHQNCQILQVCISCFKLCIVIKTSKQKQCNIFLQF